MEGGMEGGWRGDGGGGGERWRMRRSFSFPHACLNISSLHGTPAAVTNVNYIVLFIIKKKNRKHCLSISELVVRRRRKRIEMKNRKKKKKKKKRRRRRKRRR
jgi:hypothetical protein